MSSLLGLAEQEWSRLLDLAQAFSTIVVALLVAWLATTRETRVQKAQRHFEFRDERAQFYARFIQKMNTAFAQYWDCLGLDDDPFHDEKRAAELAALELDTQAHKIQIHSPNFVAHACLNVNGHIQAMVSGMMFGDVPVEPVSAEYEKAKRNMLRAMRRDLELIEQTPNRGAYARLMSSEDKRYFAQANLQEPTK